MRVYTAIAAALVLAAPLAAPGQDQVQVSVKVIEFQTSKSTETGLSAYFQQRAEPRPYGRVSSGNGSINTADITFPNRTTAGITVFLDRLVTKYGDIEIVLQALVDEGRAFILSEPTALVPVGEETPTTIKTTQDVPYEDTVVVGSTAVQITNFKPTGVSLDVKATRIVDDDGNPDTRDDTYIQLNLNASVKEEGQRITVALDDSLAGTGNLFERPANEIRVPEFVSRQIMTDVWVRHGQVLMLGGLYRNTEDKDLATLPWLAQGDRVLNGLVQRIVPFAVEPVPISSSIGNNQFSRSRRELAFLIKADVPPPIFDIGVDNVDRRSILMRPTEVVGGVIRGLADIPQGLAEEVTGQSFQSEITRGIPGDESMIPADGDRPSAPPLVEEAPDAGDAEAAPPADEEPAAETPPAADEAKP